MQPKVKPLAVAVMLVTAGCVGPTEYAPAASANQMGYFDTRLSENLWIVRARVNGASRPHGGRDMVFRRAAELIAEEGYTYFQVIAQEGQTSPIGSVGVMPGEQFSLHVRGADSPEPPSEEDCRENNPRLCFTLSVASVLAGEIPVYQSNYILP